MEVSNILSIFVALKHLCGTSMPPHMVAFVVSAILEIRNPIGAVQRRVVERPRWLRTSGHSNAHVQSHICLNTCDMKRIKTPQSQNRDYEKLLKDYFGRFLYGLSVEREGGQIRAQIVYFDFKHIDTVRRELAQMMPEVEFVKLKRDYTTAAQAWTLRQMLMPECHQEPVIYVQQGNTLVKSTLRDIAISELHQLELDEDDDIDYAHDSDIKCCCKEENLYDNSFD